MSFIPTNRLYLFLSALQAIYIYVFHTCKPSMSLSFSPSSRLYICFSVLQAVYIVVSQHCKPSISLSFSLQAVYGFVFQACKQSMSIICLCLSALKAVNVYIFQPRQSMSILRLCLLVQTVYVYSIVFDFQPCKPSMSLSSPCRPRTSTFISRDKWTETRS